MTFPAEKIEGAVERVTFHSEETGFCVLQVKARSHDDLVTIVGHLPNIVPGEWVQATGAWVKDRKHGHQFKAEQLKSVPPDSIEGIEKFLGSGLIKGIGPIYASRLVAKFGKEIFDIIEHQSGRLEDVDGIGRVRRQRIKESWNETRAVRGIMAFLLAHGVSTARAFRIYKTYGEQAIEQVRADPYCLARDIHGIGFKTADQIAERLGIEKTSDLRARAGVEYTLLEITDDGHCAFPRPGLVEAAAKILQIPGPIIEQAIDHGLEQRRLVQETIPGFDDPLIYLASLHYAEAALARHLKLLATGPHPCPPIDTEKAIAWCQEQIKLTLAPAQQEALRLAVRAKVMILTGGPGVGKTTLVNALIRILSAKKMHIVLCAPTGRAAKRMKELTGREAKTIHRLLAYDPGKGRFRHDEHNPLGGDVFIIDEASMIDVTLAHQLIRAIPPRAAVLFVGDVDQLPSVGPGMVLRDLIDSGAFPVCRLTEIFRQAAASDIVMNAHKVHDGILPAWGSPEKKSDFYFIQVEEPELAAARVVKLVRESIPKKFGFDPIDDIQVLTPMRISVLGAQNLNQELQRALNPEGDQVERFGCAYRLHDKVMQIENNYNKDVFNGDIGRITRINHEDHEITVRFDEREVQYDVQELDELAPSYAITIHKSQGSEYPCVVIPIHTQHYIMLQRNLLYTAITRGKRLVVLVGTQKALAIAVKKQDIRRRITTLKIRLQEVG